MDCSCNFLIDIDVARCTALEKFICKKNQLNVLDISKNIRLKYIDCSYNKLNSLNVQNSRTLRWLFCGNNQIAMVDISSCLDLMWFWTDYCNNLVPVNHSELTAEQNKELSFPAQWLYNKNKFNGQILDYGCGHGFDVFKLQQLGCIIDGYDLYYQPIIEQKQYDIIICTFVLNVLLPKEQHQIFCEISKLLAPDGVVYLTVSRGVQYEGLRVYIPTGKFTYHCNVILPYKSIFNNKFCEIYEISYPEIMK